jgi:hypothetical protein
VKDRIMGIERLEATDEQRKYLVTAIEREADTAVASLLQRFGREVWLKHRRVEQREPCNVFHEIQGTALNIAAHLGKDALAATLVRQGAEVKTGYTYFGAVDDENEDEGYDVTTVTVIDDAVRNKLVWLARALMERSPGVDWNHQNSHTARGDFNSMLDDSLFNHTRRFETTLEFLEEVGLFAGKVGQSMVRITGAAGSFNVVMDGLDKGYYPTMGAGLAAVATELGMEAIEPIPPLPPSLPATNVSFGHSPEDDIPY